MSYSFLDAYSSVQTADSSVVSGVIQRPIVDIGSVLTSIPVTSSGNTSVSGTVGASVIGVVPTRQTNTVITSISGTVTVASIIGVTRNAPIASWVSGVADMRGNSGASVAVIAAAGANISNYVTGVQVTNYGPTSVLVTLAGSPSGGSVLGYTIAPAGGGSNIIYSNALKTGANLPFTASINGVSSVLISAQGFTA